MKTWYLFATLLAVVLPLAAHAAAPIPDNAEQSITKGLDFLKTQQKPDGSWERPGDPPAMTAPPRAPTPKTAEKPITKGLDFQKPQKNPEESGEPPGNPPAMTALPLK